MCRLKCKIKYKYQGTLKFNLGLWPNWTRPDPTRPALSCKFSDPTRPAGRVKSRATLSGSQRFDGNSRLSAEAEGKNSQLKSPSPPTRRQAYVTLVCRRVGIRTVSPCTYSPGHIPRTFSLPDDFPLPVYSAQDIFPFHYPPTYSVKRYT